MDARDREAGAGWDPRLPLTFGPLKAALPPLILRFFDVGRRQAPGDRSLALGAPLLAVVGSFDDSV
ncbi:MAG TPA: hypothetical protein VM736_15740, partial [Gemmatimonadales bacterium]|nr:hypothetical protein [Gemmatimonadales bacterium]